MTPQERHYARLGRAEKYCHAGPDDSVSWAELLRAVWRWIGRTFA